MSVTEPDTTRLRSIVDLYEAREERERAVQAIPILRSYARAKRMATLSGEPLLWDPHQWGVTMTERAVLRHMVKDAVSDREYYLAYGDRLAISTALGTYHNTVGRALRDLEARGFLRRVDESQHGNGVLYSIDLRPPEARTPC